MDWLYKTTVDELKQVGGKTKIVALLENSSKGNNLDSVTCQHLNSEKE